MIKSYTTVIAHKKLIALLILTALLLICAKYDCWSAEINETKKINDNIKQYTSTNKYYLIDASPVKYTYEEIKQAIKITGELSENAKSSCIERIYEYIYAFPGYKYQKISGVATEGHVYDKEANVYISIDGEGLISNEIGTYLGVSHGDSYRFDLKYNHTTGECKILHHGFSNWIIPKEIVNKAILLANEHPEVKKFIEEKQVQSNQPHVWGWIDEYKGPGTNQQQLLKTIPFRKPIRGIVILELYSSDYYMLWVYVDMFNGDIFTEGPIFNPPR